MTERCLVINDDETDCTRPVVAYAVIQDRTGIRVDVPMCSMHKAKHNQRAAEMRVTQTTRSSKTKKR